MIPNETTSPPLSQSTSTVNTGTEGTKSDVHNGVDEKFSGGATPMMSFGQAVSTCLRKYATFKGRARRSEFWGFELFHLLVVMALGVLMAVSELIPGDASRVVVGLLACLAYFALLLPSISVCVRRLHDTGCSGWWYLSVLIPYFNIITSIVLLVWYCKDSYRGENKYGPSPKYPNS